MFNSPTLNEKNFDLLFSKFVEAIKLTINNHSPLEKMTCRQKRLRTKPWITKGLLNSIKKKQKLHNSYYYIAKTPLMVIFMKSTQIY